MASTALSKLLAVQNSRANEIVNIFEGFQGIPRDALTRDSAAAKPYFTCCRDRNSALETDRRRWVNGCSPFRLAPEIRSPWILRRIREKKDIIVLKNGQVVHNRGEFFLSIRCTNKFPPFFFIKSWAFILKERNLMFYSKYCPSYFSFCVWH